MRRLAIALLGSGISACAVGPDYRPPETVATAGFGETDAVFAMSEPVADFWQGLDDPLLARLVRDALAHDTDLRAALARLDEARALARLSRHDLLPAVTAGVGYTETHLSEDQAPGEPRDRRDSDLYDAGVDAFWELDLFGRVRRSVEASRGEAEASAADLRALQVSVAAEVVRTYFELRGAQEQLRVARENAENQASSLELTQARLDGGRGTDFDVARARSLVAFTRSRIPALEAVVLAAMHRLAVLDGRPPTALRAELEPTLGPPRLPAAVAIGTPAELLRRRPDVQAAERRLAASTARIGVATADLFPRVTFNGSFGAAASDLGDLFTRDAQTYAFGPAIGWAFLDLGRVRARVAASDANAEGSLALYEGTVLRALEEAETALVTYTRAQREGASLTESASAAETAARLARIRFEGGASDFLQVLDAERSLLEAEDRLAVNRTQAGVALVAVYKAVAGGWPERLPAELSAAP